MSDNLSPEARRLVISRLSTSASSLRQDAEKFERQYGSNSQTKAHHEADDWLTEVSKSLTEKDQNRPRESRLRDTEETPAPLLATIYFLRGEIGASRDEREAARELANKLRLPDPRPEDQVARLDPYIAEVVKGYVVRQSGGYYLCGLVGFHKSNLGSARTSLT